MKYLFRLLKPSVWRASSPLRFPTTGFPVMSESVIVEEEQLDEFGTRKYYGVNIGDIYASKYQVVGKLGFGSTSTVWLARSLREQKYVTLKIFRQGIDGEEFEMYKHINEADPSHPGFGHVRTALDMFKLQADEGHHLCLVQNPMWDSWKDMLQRNHSHRFTEKLLKTGLSQLFLALDYLHTKCHLVHTDIKADNIMIELVDESVLDAFTKAELETPSSRKLIDGAHPLYVSRRFDLPSQFGDVVLSDFGAAVRGDEKQNCDAQPNVYRSPEVMLEVEWSYPIDIWNVGAMIWDIFEARHLFYGNELDDGRYTTRAHLAELVAMLGPPPLDLLQKGNRSNEFFTEDGQWKADFVVPKSLSLEGSVQYLEGESRDKFLEFVREMLQWRPEDRKTAAQLLKHPWLQS